MTFIFLIILAWLAWVDFRYLRIPNVVVIPAILGGCLLTGYWLWSIDCALLAALFYHRGKWAGGDVKLMAMVGAFLGWPGAFIAPLTIMALHLFKKSLSKPILHGIPVAPFCLLVSLFFIW